MSTDNPRVSVSKRMLWSGRLVSVLVSLFFVVDCAMKLADLPMVTQASMQLGFPVSLDRVLGVIELMCLLLYAIPRTSVLGAILLTGYLGGAIAVQLRIGAPIFGNTLFGLYLGLMTWGGLYLRDERIRALIPRLR